MNRASVKKRGTQNQKNSGERNRNRWLMVMYDSLLFVLCWAAIFILHLSMVIAPPLTTSLLYLAVGYALFFGFRFLLNCYKQIWRYGTMRAFARELTAGLLAAFLFVSLGVTLTRVFSVAEVPFVSLVSFVAVYIMLSMSVRVFYYYMYLYAGKKKALSAIVRVLIEKFAFVDFDSQNPGATWHLMLVPENPPSPINDMKHVVEQFAIDGEIISITQINKGYINRTYKVETLTDDGERHKYTLQRINTNVFPDVDALMENFKLTTDHLCRSFLLPGHREMGSVQTVQPTRDGRAYLKDASGCWRMMTYFDGVYSLDIPDSPETFYQAGSAFGRFLKEMSDVDVHKVKEVIPNFHNTKSRYEALEEAISRDLKGRVKNVTAEIEFVRARSQHYGMISDALESGEIPTRVCHNDCNLNNILFDNNTHLPVAIIDLDTVMPASPLYDFGDSMRIGTNTAKDDEKDLSKVSCDLELYEQYARGYLAACGDVLTQGELELMPYASLIITVEDGIRFLTDYLNGDVYFNIYYPDQNLDRARTQLKLVEDMEVKLPDIKQILQRIYAELGLQAHID